MHRYWYWHWDKPILLGIGCLFWYRSNPTHHCLTPTLGGIPSEFLDETYTAKSRGMGLLYGENCMILSLTVFDWSTRVTDRQTDGHSMLSRTNKTECDSIGNWSTDEWRPVSSWWPSFIGFGYCDFPFCRFPLKAISRFLGVELGLGVRHRVRVRIRD